jgi:hypothetical protein
MSRFRVQVTREGHQKAVRGHTAWHEGIRLLYLYAEVAERRGRGV